MRGFAERADVEEVERFLQEHAAVLGSEVVPLLVDHFLASSTKMFGRDQVRLDPAVLERLQMHAWPGNVRELENCIERMVVLAHGPRITPADLPPELHSSASGPRARLDGFDLPPGGVRLPDVERHLIRQALIRTRGNLAPAAKMLGISYKTLQYRIRKHRLDRESFGGEPGGANGAQLPYLG